MVANTDCTIFRLDEMDNSVLSILCFDAVMWQDTLSTQTKRYGAENADKVTVYIPDIHADVQNGDRIMRGKAITITDDIINSAFLITTVSKHDYGSDAMQHIRVGAN